MTHFSGRVTNDLGGCSVGDSLTASFDGSRTITNVKSRRARKLKSIHLSATLFGADLPAPF